jgi:hypothetical protein
LEKSLEDDKVTLGRIDMAPKCDKENASTWERKGMDVCEILVKDADAALKRVKKREASHNGG